MSAFHQHVPEQQLLARPLEIAVVVVVVDASGLAFAFAFATVACASSTASEGSFDVGVAAEPAVATTVAE